MSLRGPIGPKSPHDGQLEGEARVESDGWNCLPCVDGPSPVWEDSSPRAERGALNDRRGSAPGRVGRVCLPTLSGEDPRHACLRKERKSRALDDIDTADLLADPADAFFQPSLSKRLPVAS